MIDIQNLGSLKDSMTAITRYGTTRRWSDVVVHGGVAYFVEVPADAAATPEAQFSQIFQQVKATLQSVGSRLDRLLQVMVYLPYPEDLAEFNRQWDNWIPEGHAPSRACLHAALVNPAYRVELVITAAIIER